MLLCIRVIPSKLSSFVGTRNQMMELDRRLTKLISTSALINEASVPSRRVTQVTQNEVILNSLVSTRTGIDFHNLGILSCATALKLAKKKLSDPITESINLTQSSKDNTNAERSSGLAPQHLQTVHDTLCADLPQFFTTTLNYNIYHKDLEFINHFKSIQTKGISEYIKQVMITRVTGHLAYVYIKFEVIKITIHPEDNTVRVRWRIRGLSGFKAITHFWKFKWLRLDKEMQNIETWYDGFSTYYVGPDGKVFRHIADKMMPDDETVQVKDKSNIAAKLAA